MFNRKHICVPKVIHIQALRKEVGGESWLVSAKNFDELFCGEVVWSVKGQVWGIRQISGSEFMKIYRGE